MRKLLIYSVVLFFALNVGFSQNLTTSYLSESYQYYTKHQESRDSIINSAKIEISKNAANLEPRILIGFIYMNESKFDSAIVHLQITLDNCLNNKNGKLHFYPEVAFRLLDAYRFSYRFKEFNKYYSLYWAFLSDKKYKERLEELEENAKLNIRWWFIDYARQIALSEFNEKSESYLFYYLNKSEYPKILKDKDASRLAQYNPDSTNITTVMMFPNDTSIRYYYCFYFDEYELNSYLKISQNDFNNFTVYSKDMINKQIKKISAKKFDKTKASLNWQNGEIYLDDGTPIEVLSVDKK